MARKASLLALLFSLSSGALPAADRATQVRNDLEQITAAGRWIYNDLPRGFEEAKATGKPLLVVFRCIPCQSCRGFDEEIAIQRKDPRTQELLDRFVRVRIPQANGMDLSLFQFDFDLSFYAFFLNADRTIYGRFGTRSTQEDKTGDVSVDAFREAMSAALDLHGRFSQVREALQKKTGPAPAIKVPEQHPTLAGRYTSTIDYKGKVVESCIHCHQIRDAERNELRADRKPIPDRVLHPWPLPDVLGVTLDPRKRATVSRVEKDSTAERAGLRPGDELAALEGQPLISIADVQWVLEATGEEAKLAARVRREGKELDLVLPLEKGWRKRSEVSWRVSTWNLRRLALGGLQLVEVPAEERAQTGVGPGDLALLVKNVGEYGEHAVAKKAGFKKGDVIVSLDGRKEPLTETGFISRAVQEKLPGDRLSVGVLRAGKRLDLELPLK